MARAKIEISGDSTELAEYVNAFHTTVDIYGFYQELRRIWKWGQKSEYGAVQDIYDLFHEYLGHHIEDGGLRSRPKKSKFKRKIAKILLGWL
jgi:hypothetical protein